MATASSFDASQLLAELNQQPGVYQLLDGDGVVLYVGKARSLKRRLASYFRAPGRLDNKTRALVSRVRDIRVTVTHSETEALLLEQNLIKQERPRYNILLRDDKSYPYIHLTAHPEFPRLSFHRGARRREGRYFGPYPSAGAVRETLNLLQKLFRIRQCDETFFKNRSRPCLQYQIKRCSAPCVGLVDADAYRHEVDLAVLFLEGRDRQVLEICQRKMRAAADVLDFEKAAVYRDQIGQLQRLQGEQSVHGASGNADVFALAGTEHGEAGGAVCVQALFIRAGRMLGQRTWFPDNVLGRPPASLLAAFLSQFYLGGRDRDLPAEVIAPITQADARLLAAAMAERCGRSVTVSPGRQGRKARWRKLATENAQVSFSVFQAGRKTVFARLVDLQRTLELEAMPQRLECFDISHTSGEATVAACVVFDTEGPRKSDYRRFNIQGIAPGDDYAAMEQALRRRYTRLKQGEGVLPDLLVIDGGKGQIARALQVLAELQVAGVLILGVVKAPGRRAGQERILLDGQPVAIHAGSEAFHLLTHIRDEAHRFAITGHRQRRRKSQHRSELDGISGIGPKRRRELLTHFGGLSALKGASVEEIARTPGISRHLAGEVFAALHAG